MFLWLIVTPILNLIWFYQLLFVYPLRIVKDLPFPFRSTYTLRTKLRNMVFPVHSAAPTQHSHPQSAVSRNSADEAINLFISSNGYVPYCIQMSSRDIAAGHRGSLIHYWAADRHAPERSQRLRDCDIVKMTNVDYYVDWVQYLWMARPFMLYTFTPKDPCGVYQETQWTTNLDNSITMTVSGGGRYNHQLWNYNVDSIEAYYPGIQITYSVESVPVNEHWSIVMLTPKSITAAPDDTRSHCTLKRHQLVHTVHTMDGSDRPSALMRHSGSAAVLSVGIPGQMASIRLSASTQSILSARVDLGRITFADLVSLLTPDFGNDVRLAQAIVYKCFPCEVPQDVSWHTPWVDRDNLAAYRRAPTAQLLPQEKPSGTVIAPPVIDSGFVPVRSRANEEWTIEKRVDAVRNDQTQFLPRYMLYAAEFAELLIPVPHVLGRIDVSDVIASQKRPTQVLNNAAASPRLSSWFAVPECTVKSFQKGEVAACPSKDPRNISTLPTEHCLLYSQYTQPFASLLKTQPWYAFGLHPDAVAHRVHSVAANAKTLTETDFSRFDGTHSHALYALELNLYLRAFPPIEHDMITRVHAAMTTALGRTTMGVQYDPDGGRLSGAADTSIMNSIDNAFVAYCVFRQMGYATKAAYRALGVYGGDDGITADADPTCYNRVVTDLGLKLKAISRPAYDRTTFLGRVYPQPASSAVHMADVPRQLAKLHIHCSRDPEECKYALFNKAVGHLVTDPTTPILSDWARMVIRLLPDDVKVNDVRSRSYISTEYHGFTSAPAMPVMMEVLNSVLGLDSTEINDYIQHLRNLTSLDLLQPLIRPQGRVPIDNVIVGKDIGKMIPVKATACPHGCGYDACEHDPTRTKLVDIAINCKKCSLKFVYTEKEQKFALKYADSQPPKACSACRLLRKSVLPVKPSQTPILNDASDKKRSDAKTAHDVKLLELLTTEKKILAAEKKLLDDQLQVLQKDIGPTKRPMKAPRVGKAPRIDTPVATTETPTRLHDSALAPMASSTRSPLIP